MNILLLLLFFIFKKKLERKKGKNPNFDKHVTRFVFFFHNFFKNKNIKTKYIFLLITKSLNKKKKRMPAKHDKPVQKPSLQPDHLLIPNGQLLRGVPVQGRGEYKIPLTTDVHSFAIRKRTTKG